MTSVLHSVLHLDALAVGQGWPAAPRAVGEVGTHGGGAGAAEPPPGGSIGRPGPTDEIEGPHHGRESKNPDPPRFLVCAHTVTSLAAWEACGGSWSGPERVWRDA